MIQAVQCLSIRSERSDYMYIIYVKDGLGGWFECGAYDSYNEAYEAMSEMSKDDPFHQYRIVHK